MARPDMVFTLAEVDAAERAAGRRPLPGPAPTGPDMVFTESELATASPSTLTTEERDRARGPAPVSAERAAALAGAGRSRGHEVATGVGAVNDGLSVVTGMASALDSPLPDAVGGVGNTAAGIGELADAGATLLDDDASDEDRRAAWWGGGVGALDTASGIAGIAGEGTASDAIGGLSGLLEFAGGVDAIMNGDEAAGWQQVLHGGLAGASSVAAVLGGDGLYSSPVIAAGAAGASTGTWMSDRSEAVSMENGSFTERRMAARGLDAPMEDYNVSASEEAAIRAVEDQQLVTEYTGSETLGMIAGGASSIGRGWYNGFTNLW